MATGNYDGARAGAKHIPGAIAILLASSNYDPADNGKRVMLVRKVTTGEIVDLRYKGEVAVKLFKDKSSAAFYWEVTSVDNHLHLSAAFPICLDNNIYMQKHLLIIGDESLLATEIMEKLTLLATELSGLASNHN